MLKNPIYKGIYILHSTKKDKAKIESPPMESFKIIPTHEWDETQEIMKNAQHGNEANAIQRTENCFYRVWFFAAPAAVN